MCTVYCTLYTVLYKLYTVHCTSLHWHCTLYIVLHCTVHIPLHSVHFTLNTVNCTLPHCSSLYTVLHCTVYTVWFCTLCFTLHSTSQNTVLYRQLHFTVSCTSLQWIVQYIGDSSPIMMWPKCLQNTAFCPKPGVRRRWEKPENKSWCKIMKRRKFQQFKLNDKILWCPNSVSLGSFS